MNIREAMLQRKSVRTYSEEPIPSDLRQKLDEFIADLETPFSAKLRFKIADMSKSGEDLKLGTYGVIKGAKSFICAAAERENNFEEKLGYAFEKIILYATKLGLGTCWMGGTFNRPEFAKAVGLKKSELIPIISPVGFAKEKRSFLDNMMVMLAGSKNRKDWSELFFDKSFDKPLTKENSGKFNEAFEMIRIAPSASNKQPWRIVQIGNKFCFFISRNIGYGSALGYDIQRLDIGIAMCHLESALNELGYTGKWDYSNPGLTAPGSLEYITSFIMDEKLS